MIFLQGEEEEEEEERDQPKPGTSHSKFNVCKLASIMRNPKSLQLLHMDIHHDMHRCNLSSISNKNSHISQATIFYTNISLFFIGICPQILLHNLLHNPLLSLHWNALVCNRMSSYVCIYMYECISISILQFKWEPNRLKSSFLLALF